MLRRDRRIVAGALALLVVVAWTYIFRSGAGMGGGAMGNMAGMPVPAWTIVDAALVLAMWAVMMVGMMTPSAAPMILLYACVGRQARAQAYPFAATAWFAAGYLTAWLAFSVLATGAQWALESAALLTPMMESANRRFTGFLLIAAGAYQWTPLKYACVAQCQAPLAFIQRHGGFRPQASAAFRLGLLHGGYCVGCCWALMALLFAGGVMNPIWIAGLGTLAVLEKIAPGRLVPRLVGAGLLAAGGWVLGGSALLCVFSAARATSCG